MTYTNMTKNTDPLIKRITVKEAGSILVSARAQRHNTELPAKASIATAEYIHVVIILFTNHIDALYFARLTIL